LWLHLLKLANLLTTELKPLHRLLESPGPSRQQNQRQSQLPNLLQLQQPKSPELVSLHKNKKPLRGFFYGVNNLINPTLSIAVSKM
jgi:hypothetical protein